MTIDIKGLPGGSINNTGSSNQTETVSNSSSSNSSRTNSSLTGGADKVSLTTSATQLRTLEEKISSLPVVNSQRVATTQHALATGSHVINPGSTAENLLNSERAFA